MKATTLLKKQHDEVEALFDQLEEGSDDTLALLMDLANHLAAHMAIEQTIFYPAVRDIEPELVGRSYEEHALAEIAMKRLLSAEPDGSTFAAKVTALRELIEHHVEEEEEELFPAVEEALETEHLETLGGDIATAFEQAFEKGYEALLPEGFTTSADEANASPLASRNDDGGERTRPRRRRHVPG